MPLYTLTFAGGDTKRLPGGNYLRLLTASNAVKVEYVRAGTIIEHETADGVKAGYGGRPPRKPDQPRAFDEVRVTSATAQTVELLILQGTADYDRSVGTVDITRSATIVTTADVSMLAGALTAIRPANTARRRVLITNLAAGAATLRIGDSVNTGAARGIPLAPGETITLETTAAISGWNPGGVAQSVAVLEETD